MRVHEPSCQIEKLLEEINIYIYIYFKIINIPINIKFENIPIFYIYNLYKFYKCFKQLIFPLQKLYFKHNLIKFYIGFTAKLGIKII